MQSKLVGGISKLLVKRGMYGAFNRYYPVRTFKFQKTYSPGYYLLLREIPPLSAASDYAASNYAASCESDEAGQKGKDLSHVFEDDIPDLIDITPICIVNAMMEACSKLESTLSDSKQLAEDVHNRTKFTEIFAPLMDAVCDLDVHEKACQALGQVLGQNHLIAFMLSYESAAESKSYMFLDENMYLASREILGDLHDKLVEDDRLRLRQFNDQAYMTGCGLLNDRTRVDIRNAMDYLRQEQQRYCLKLSFCTTSSDYIITNRSAMEGIPSEILKSTSVDWKEFSEGPWKMRMRPKLVHAFLSHCSNRKLRREISKQYYGLASHNWASTRWDNGLHVLNVTRHRRTIATMLGYDSATDWALSNHAIRDKAYAVNLIEEIRSVLKPTLDCNVTEMKETLRRKNIDHPSSLESYDLMYYGNVVQTEKFGTALTESEPHRKIQVVVEGLLGLASKMFPELVISEQKDVKLKNRLHMSQKGRLFKVKLPDDDQSSSSYMAFDFPPGTTFLDTNTHCFTLRDRSNSAGTISFIQIPGTANADSCPWDQSMSMDEIGSLAYEMGSGLQKCLECPNTAKELFSLKAAPEDVMTVFPHMFRLCTRHPRLLPTLCNDPDISPMTPDTGQALVASQSFEWTFELLRKLYISEFDLKLNTTTKNFLDIYRDLWPKYMPVPLPKMEFFFCQLPELFGHSSTSFYCHKVVAQLRAARLVHGLNVGRCGRLKPDHQASIDTIRRLVYVDGWARDPKEFAFAELDTSKVNFDHVNLITGQNTK